jgi:hypothetical protein
MSARFAVGGGALAALVRESHDLSAAWRETDKALLAALSKPDGQQEHAAVDALRKQLGVNEAVVFFHSGDKEAMFLR